MGNANVVGGKRYDPIRGYNFRVTVPGFVAELGFQKVSGLKIGVKMTEYREGGMNATMRKLPSLVEYDDITLERGVTANVNLVRWMEDLVALDAEKDLPDEADVRKDIQIDVLDRKQRVVRTYLVLAALPKSLELGDLSADDEKVLVEKLVLAHEGLVLSSVTDIKFQE